MTRLPLAVLCFLCLCACCFAQDHLSALERVREIKLLQDDRFTVRQVLSDYLLNHSSDLLDDFSLGSISIEVFYSTETCDEDYEEVWDIAEGKAVRIEITDDVKLTPEALGIDLTKFQREQVFAYDEDLLIYHNKKRGLAIKTEGNTIETIILFPPVSTKSKPCGTKFAKEFVSMKSWFGSKKLKDRRGIICINEPANVTAIKLSHSDITALTPKSIKVSVTAVDPEGDILIYNYVVSGGRIIGSGANVVWDLTGAAPGTYTITAAVDDGCGFCGQTMTKTVVVK